MASNQDKFQYVGVPGTATTLAAPGYTAGVTTSINVGSTSNWPTASGTSFAIDQVTLVNGVEERVPGTYVEFTGVVSGGTTISSLDLNFGTDQNFPAGSTTRVYIPVSSTRENALIDGLLVAHEQDGSLKAGAVGSAATLASNVVTTAKILDANVTTAKIADANVTNAKIADTAVTPAKLQASTGTSWAWQAYVPTFANLSVGNGTLIAYYCQTGKTVNGYISLLFGSTTAISGSVTFAFPVPAAARYATANRSVLGQTTFVDTGTNTYPGYVFSPGSTTIATLSALNASGTYSTEAQLSATVPYTWTTNDVLNISFVYEAA